MDPQHIQNVRSQSVWTSNVCRIAGVHYSFFLVENMFLAGRLLAIWQQIRRFTKFIKIHSIVKKIHCFKDDYIGVFWHVLYTYQWSCTFYRATHVFLTLLDSYGGCTIGTGLSSAFQRRINHQNRMSSLKVMSFQRRHTQSIYNVFWRHLNDLVPATLQLRIFILKKHCFMQIACVLEQPGLILASSAHTMMLVLAPYASTWLLQSWR